MDTKRKKMGKMKNEKSVFLREILRESLRLLIIVTSKSTVCASTNKLDLFFFVVLFPIYFPVKINTNTCHRFIVLVNLLIRPYVGLNKK